MCSFNSHLLIIFYELDVILGPREKTMNKIVSLPMELIFLWERKTMKRKMYNLMVGRDQCFEEK